MSEQTLITCPLPKWGLDPDIGLRGPDGKYLGLSPIDRHEAETSRPAHHAKSSTHRAVVFLRMLIGEREWSDGAERSLDDCFEMNDGDEVVRTIVAIAESVPAIKRLITRHRNAGQGTYDRWHTYATT